MIHPLTLIQEKRLRELKSIYKEHPNFSSISEFSKKEQLKVLSLFNFDQNLVNNINDVMEVLPQDEAIRIVSISLEKIIGQLEQHCGINTNESEMLTKDAKQKGDSWPVLILQKIWKLILRR